MEKRLLCPCCIIVSSFFIDVPLAIKQIESISYDVQNETAKFILFSIGLLIMFVMMYGYGMYKAEKQLTQDDWNWWRVAGTNFLLIIVCYPLFLLSFYFAGYLKDIGVIIIPVTGLFIVPIMVIWFSLIPSIIMKRTYHDDGLQVKFLTAFIIVNFLLGFNPYLFG